MKSFEHGYLYDTPVSHALLRTMRALGEYRGRQALYTHQFPEILETLRRAAVVQSVESSSRIEGVVVARLPARFTIGELARTCGGISRRTLVRALQDLRAEGGVRCLGRGPDAEWERTGR